MEQTYTFSINHLHNELEQVKSCLSVELAEKKLDEDTIASIELAVYEAVMNIIDHGEREYIEYPIGITIDVGNDLCRITIQNVGKEYNPLNKELPDLEKHASEGKKRGLGLYMIRKIMDVVEYSYSEGVNSLVFKKQLNK